MIGLKILVKSIYIFHLAVSAEQHPREASRNGDAPITNDNIGHVNQESKRIPLDLLVT